jgi:hypothetical protein
MTQSEAMLHECLDEVEEVLRSYQHRRLHRKHAWASTVTRAFELDNRVITMGLTVDVTAPSVNDEASPDDIA